MFLVNGFKAKLRKFNRQEQDSAYDDMNYTEEFIKICPYSAQNSISFGEYTYPKEAQYFIVPRRTDIRAGDQIVFVANYSNNLNDLEKLTYTVLDAKYGWLYNRIENKLVVVQ